MTTTTNSTLIDYVIRVKIVNDIVQASREISRLQAEMEELEPYVHNDITAYKKYRMKREARNTMLQQIRYWQEALRTLSDNTNKNKNENENSNVV
jgi:FtsZ-binding cell division protein ZapB